MTETETIMADMTRRYGTDLYQRMKKLFEEVRELRNAIAYATEVEQLDELADVQIIVAHMAALLHTTTDQLILSAHDKICRRDTDPTYKHQRK